MLNRESYSPGVFSVTWQMINQGRIVGFRRNSMMSQAQIAFDLGTDTMLDEASSLTVQAIE